MKKESWDKSYAKKLFECFMEIEKSQYPPQSFERLDHRKNLLEKFILEFGVNHLSITNYTNMMQILSSITVDVFDSKRWMEGSISVGVGSEPYELWATRGEKVFDFNNWLWIDKPKSTEMYEE